MIDENKLNRLKDLIDRFAPLGEEDSPCHAGICSMLDCSRCQDAFQFREYLIYLIEYLTNREEILSNQIIALEMIELIQRQKIEVLKGALQSITKEN